MKVIMIGKAQQHITNLKIIKYSKQNSLKDYTYIEVTNPPPTRLIETLLVRLCDLLAILDLILRIILSKENVA